MLSMEGCRARQRRMLARMEAQGWDLFVTANYRTVYYFTGLLGSPDAPALFALHGDGNSFAIHSASGDCVADELIKLEVYSIDRAITAPVHDMAKLLGGVLRGTARNVAAERASLAGLLEERLGIAPADATSAVLALRKRKEPDEVAEIREALVYCEVAYDAAREAIAPGRTEIEVYSAMYAAVVRAADTSIPFPGDFACGKRAIRGGGAPTARVIEPHDLYILDLFPAPALYFADTCRTFAATEPTDDQARAHELVLRALRMAEEAIRPGVAARDVYRIAKDFLDGEELAERSFYHHLGHGIGHHGHEAPRIIPGTDDIFEAGDVMTLEPGIYSERLHGGIRLEDNYLVTASGVEKLFEYPLGL